MAYLEDVFVRQILQLRMVNSASDISIASGSNRLCCGRYFCSHTVPCLVCADQTQRRPRERACSSIAARNQKVEDDIYQLVVAQAHLLVATTLCSEFLGRLEEARDQIGPQFFALCQRAPATTNDIQRKVTHNTLRLLDLALSSSTKEAIQPKCRVAEAVIAELLAPVKCARKLVAALLRVK